MKFMSKKGVTLTHHDWSAGVDCDVSNEEIEPSNTENDKDEVEEESEAPMVEPAAKTVAHEANPTHGEPVENIEEDKTPDLVDRLLGTLL